MAAAPPTLGPLIGQTFSGVQRVCLNADNIWESDRKGTVTVALCDTGDRASKIYHVTLALFRGDCTEGDPFYAVELQSSMLPHYEQESCTFSWMSTHGGKAMTFGLVFEEEDASTFANQFFLALFEVSSGKKISDLKAGEEAWIMRGQTDDVDDDAASQVDDALSDDDEAWMSAEEGFDDDDDEGVNEAGDGINKLLSVGFSQDRSYVVRGSQIGVFGQDHDAVTFKTTIDRIRDLDGQTFSPSRMQLHQSDNSLLLLNTNNDEKKSIVYKMDLNRGQIVEEYDTNGMDPVRELAPMTKYEQLTDQQVFVGLNKQSLFYMDPRVGRECLVADKIHKYSRSTKPLMSCVATTNDGMIAVGAQTGEIRMFNDVSKRAKTTLPGLGDPILGIDTTGDGAWILATCETYLLLIPTTSSAGVLGFRKPMGGDKPVPRKLKLNAKDVARIGGHVAFTTAHFDTGGDKERCIVTSTGPWVITWNFRRAAKGFSKDYQMKQYSEDVVADQFRYKSSSSVIVATGNNVSLAKRACR